MQEPADLVSEGQGWTRTGNNRPHIFRSHQSHRVTAKTELGAKSRTVSNLDNLLCLWFCTVRDWPRGVSALTGAGIKAGGLVFR